METFNRLRITSWHWLALALGFHLCLALVSGLTAYKATQIPNTVYLFKEKLRRGKGEGAVTVLGT